MKTRQKARGRQGDLRNQLQAKLQSKSDPRRTVYCFVVAEYQRALQSTWSAQTILRWQSRQGAIKHESCTAACVQFLTVWRVFPAILTTDNWRGRRCVTTARQVFSCLSNTDECSEADHRSHCAVRRRISFHTCAQPYVPLVNGLVVVDDWLLHTRPRCNQASLQIIRITYRCLIHSILHDTPNFVIHWKIHWQHICQKLSKSAQDQHSYRKNKKGAVFFET